MERIFKNKRILVTGGTGSIGGEIVRQLLRHGPEVIRVFSRNEHNQYVLSEELQEHKKRLRFFIGDVRDASRLKLAMTDVDIVFHAAALKHVPICEYNPFEAVKTNVVGTQNVIDAAMGASVTHVIAISTDKAVNPVNTMGATKLLAERLITSANSYKGSRDIRLATVRFGNVIGSRGSVIPSMDSQIKNGGPVTVTHPDMTRFFMTVSEAVGLVVKSCAVAHGGEVFILKMPVLKIADLASALISELAPKYGFKPSEIQIKTIGMRAGERLFEELITCEESEYMTEIDDMYVLRFGASPAPAPGGFSYNSGIIPPISIEEIIRLLKQTA